ncbi:hypothetical protein OIO90_004220 [Microbotryomycetes sp. JL221]|nr:hypothetical protein OIO90_004220 [Microbotryomycetes sp. JL221]
MNRLQLSAIGRWAPRQRALTRQWPTATGHLTGGSNTHALRHDDHSVINDSFDTLATLPTSSSMQQPVQEGGPRAATNITATPADAAGNNHASAATGASSSQERVELKKRQFLGVALPIKPPPPGPEECCQSGCATCVYDIYLESIENWHEQVSASKVQVLDKLRRDAAHLVSSISTAPRDWPEDIFGTWDPQELKQDASNSTTSTNAIEQAKVKAEKELERTRASLDPALRAFLEMEARLKKKAKAQ